MQRSTALAVIATWVLGSGVCAAEGDLEAGFRKPPDACRPARGWLGGQAFQKTLAACPPELKAPFGRALADEHLSITPEEIKRMTTWQAMVDAAAIAQRAPSVAARPQPYDALAKGLGDYAARIVYLFSRTQPAGGVFTQSKAAHGITIYPPAPGLYLVRRTLGKADVYFVASQRPIDTVVTVTFPRVVGPELWDPEDGSIRETAAYGIQDGKKTMLNLRLGPYQACFIVLRGKPSGRHVLFAPTLQVTSVTADGSAVTGLARLKGRCSIMFANGKMATHVVKDLPSPLTIESGWSMKPRAKARRGPVGIVDVRRLRADLAEEKPKEWASPTFDDSAWRTVRIGQPEAVPIASGPPWRASWLQYEDGAAVRFFRKVFDLPEAVRTATVTLTADNGYELFVNGKQIKTNAGDWKEAETYDLAKALRKGKNVLAVRNTNSGPIGGVLLEARIGLAGGRLLYVVTDATWTMSKTASDGWQKVDFDEKGWQKTNAIGKPPVEPWGDVKGLPVSPGGGEATWYRLHLPAGATGVHVPAGAKDPQLYVNGKKVPVRNGRADLSGNVPAGPVVAALRIAEAAGLDKPILCDCDAGTVGIGSWGIIGYPTYSGAADYRVELDLPAAYRKERLILDLGQVGCAAQVAVNGRDLGTRLWRPYTFDITGAVRPGKNVLQVTVANTAANASGKDLPMERLAAGILGPVRIRCLREITIRAE